jgi:hypothetical protein
MEAGHWWSPMVPNHPKSELRSRVRQAPAATVRNLRQGVSPDAGVRATCAGEMETTPWSPRPLRRELDRGVRGSPGKRLARGSRLSITSPGGGQSNWSEKPRWLGEGHHPKPNAAIRLAARSTAPESHIEENRSVSELTILACARERYMRCLGRAHHPNENRAVSSTPYGAWEPLTERLEE